jgi:hypothetical protein
MRKLIGFQICDARGTNIQGDDDDPTGEPSFAVFDPSLAGPLAATLPRGFLLMPIREGDVQQPIIITAFRRPECPTL